jgi:hypothetical protein
MPYHGLIVAAGNGRSAPVSLYAYATPQAPPACAASPTSDYYFQLGPLSGHLKTIEEGLVRIDCASLIQPASACG